MARRIFYPLYQLGNPPTRIFRTDYFLTLVRPGIPLPEDTVQFRIPMDMTRIELKDYLEKIYNVPVAAVRTRIQHGSNKQRDDKNRRIKKPDYKVAYVQLPSASGSEENKFYKLNAVEANTQKEYLGDLFHGSGTFLPLKMKLESQAAGQTFQFPDLFPDGDKAPEPGSDEEVEKKVNEEKQQNDPRRGDVPNWFWR